jgi:hypothetical protein
MPSVSGKQHRFMAMCSHTPQHARGKCPSQKVSSEFVHADKGKRFARARALKRLSQEE